MPRPSSERWLFGFVPILCEVDIVGLCLSSSERLYLVEREVVYSQVVFAQILNGGSLCGKSCVDELVKILLCEGGDVSCVLEPRNISLCLRLIHFL